MTSIIEDDLKASFRKLAFDNAMTITIQDECVVCQPKVENNPTFNMDVGRLVRAWHPIANQHGLFIEHTIMRQGDSLVIRFGHIGARVAPIVPNQLH